MCPPSETTKPGHLIRYCGADCGQCDTYQAFLAGDESGVVNPETGYRCCWLGIDFPEGHDCPIKACCERQAILFCGECGQFSTCARIQAFYAQPGYAALKKRMFDAIDRRTTAVEPTTPGE